MIDTTFSDMVHQIFQDEAMFEQCYINGFAEKCIQSSIGDNLIYSDSGLQNGVNFTLDLEIAALHRIPTEGDRVEYRGKQYKIASTDTDSANTSTKIYLISTSKGS